MAKIDLWDDGQSAYKLKCNDETHTHMTNERKCKWKWMDLHDTQSKHEHRTVKYTLIFTYIETKLTQIYTIQQDIWSLA